MSRSVTVRASASSEVGLVFGLGVSGYVGSCLEFEAATFPARENGKGALRFNEPAARWRATRSFNAASVIRRLLHKDLYYYDVHVNVVGGGRVDGPSAGLAVVVALASALENLPVPQTCDVGARSPSREGPPRRRQRPRNLRSLAGRHAQSAHPPGQRARGRGRAWPRGHPVATWRRPSRPSGPSAAGRER